jgi:hypothetical protein
MVCSVVGYIIDFFISNRQAKEFKIDIWCFSTKYAALRSKNKDWLDLNQDSLPADCCFSELAEKLLIWH